MHNTNLKTKELVRNLILIYLIKLGKIDIDLKNKFAPNLEKLAFMNEKNEFIGYLYFKLSVRGSVKHE